jgi:hypothetical protein
MYKNSLSKTKYYLFSFFLGKPWTLGRKIYVFREMMKITQFSYLILHSTQLFSYRLPEGWCLLYERFVVVWYKHARGEHEDDTIPFP